MKSETFRAFQRRSNFDGPGQIVVGVEYDVAQDIDERNQWREPSEPPNKLAEARQACMSASADSLRELVMFCFKSQPLNRRGAMKLVAQRLIAIAHHVDGDLLRGAQAVDIGRRTPNIVHRPGPPLSLAKLAKYLGTTPYQLRKHWRDYRERWSFNARIAKVRTRRSTAS